MMGLVGKGTHLHSGLPLDCLSHPQAEKLKHEAICKTWRLKYNHQAGLPLPGVRKRTPDYQFIREGFLGTTVSPVYRLVGFPTPTPSSPLPWTLQEVKRKQPRVLHIFPNTQPWSAGSMPSKVTLGDFPGGSVVGEVLCSMGAWV